MIRYRWQYMSLELYIINFTVTDGWDKERRWHITSLNCNTTSTNSKGAKCEPSTDQGHHYDNLIVFLQIKSYPLCKQIMIHSAGAGGSIIEVDTH